MAYMNTQVKEGAADEGAAGDGEAWRLRRSTAWRQAGRILSRLPQDGTLGEQLAALAADAGAVTDLGQAADIYGNGVVGELEQRVAGLLGTEAAAFFPTGTMAQQVALRCWAGRTGNTTVALHPLAHPEVHEGGALGAVSGLRTVHPASGPRLPTADEIRDFPEPFGTLMLELPLRDAGFVLPAWEELEAVVAAARERDAVVHFDGARLWECATHFGRGLPEIAALADSVYVSFYKSLGGISGAVLAGSASLVEEARVWRHRYGGLPFQQFPAAVAALAGLDRELPKLPSYVAQAKVVAEALTEGFTQAGAGWFRVRPEPPQTHQFQVWLPYGADELTEASVRQAEETDTALFRRWFTPDTGAPGVSFTEVTVTEAGLEWTAQDVRDAVAAFLERVPGKS
ncbi:MULTISPECIES: beta-eliminating lyase-related protein [unclassified Streptomyces]|uniref:threonine aldolase family protein n=1 Tax=unclassified Streptomyces TaxID=2593676 RepID=UPI002ED1D999|nr:beta-eliminating lyase-related protein [Streptomyces sp. NBC_00891]WSY06183.1 beta-eliminating lyase-related protein [Streptomyces sp. NBC_00890]WSZ07807.1 beta-eliminating lyase-related protein [Streptomyces sp. NBC_00869]WSZ24694.1 beta-eliminating lyase-related protein [Streptomyces sp. NBC_00870]